ncbi:MAG: Fe(3+) ABC transporter substrate-binding protein [Alphaproteobacteria bacterium]
MFRTLVTAVFGLAAVLLAPPAMTQAQDSVLNVYSARHYATDATLYDAFTAETGIEVRRIEAESDELIQRMLAEGRNSPADVFITVDAGNLWRAQQAGLLQPVSSPILEAAIPGYLRHEDGYWFGFAQRARVIYYNKERIDPGLVQSYADLADPALRGQVCIRTSSNIYNLSLMGSMIETLGEAGAQAWAEGVVANFARQPAGNDTAQLKAVAAGECGVAVANTYYYIRLLTSDDPTDQAIAARIGVVFPDQEGLGTHVNISGAGVAAHAPHPAAAVRFLEFLTSPGAQAYFAGVNNEYPVVDGVAPDAALASLGQFRAAPVNVAVYGENQPLAQMVYDRAGWK